MAKTKKAAQKMQACSCCSVRFRPNVCPQCYVAGCVHRGKGKPCLLNSGSRRIQGLSEYEVRERYAKLLEEHEKLLQSAGIKSNGHAEFPPQLPPGIKVTTRKIEGELQHG
jgi:hypothetical protein